MVRFLKRNGHKFQLLSPPTPTTTTSPVPPRCPLCGVAYATKGEKRRASLEMCGHVSCLGCLQDAVSSRELKCAQCKISPSLPPGEEERVVLTTQLEEQKNENEFPEIKVIRVNKVEREEEEEEDEETFGIVANVQLITEEDGEVVEVQELKPRLPDRMHWLEPQQPLDYQPEVVDLASDNESESPPLPPRPLPPEEEEDLLPPVLLPQLPWWQERVVQVKLQRLPHFPPGTRIPLRQYPQLYKPPRGGGKEKLYPCPHCQLPHICKRHLAEHLFATHSDLRPHQCPECLWPFKSAKNLEVHQRALHIREKPFQCPICAKFFAYKFSLNKHLRFLHHQAALPRAKKRRRSPLTLFSALLPPPPVPPGKENLVGRPARPCIRHKPKKSRSSTLKHPCAHCPASYPRRRDLAEHLKSLHRKERPYSCDLCGWVFCTPQKLTLHRITHTIDRPFRCPSCEATFNRKYSLDRHTRLMHLKAPRPTDKSQAVPKGSSCPYCPLLPPFPQRGELAAHFKSCHGDRRPHLCPVTECGWSFEKRKHLHAHLQNSHKAPAAAAPPPPQHQCRMCVHAFNRRYSLERHMEHVHGVRTRLSPQETCAEDRYCAECQSEFDGQKHVKVAYSKCGHVCCLECVIRAELGCSQCATEMAPGKKESEMESPVKNAPMPMPPMILDLDIIESLEVEPPKKRGSGRRKKLEIDAQGVKWLPCQLCDYCVPLNRKPEMGKHLWENHRKERPFPCAFCGWPFSSGRDLERHELIHKKERPFKCGSCQQTFNRKSALDRHVDKRHLNWREMEVD